MSLRENAEPMPSTWRRVRKSMKSSARNPEKAAGRKARSASATRPARGRRLRVSARPPSTASQHMALDALREKLLAGNDEMRGALGDSFRIDLFLDRPLYQRRLAENRSDPAPLAKLFLPLPETTREGARRRRGRRFDHPPCTVRSC